MVQKILKKVLKKIIEQNELKKKPVKKFKKII
jgi:hypothetical protein